MELLMFLDQVEIDFEVSNFVEFEIQTDSKRFANWRASLAGGMLSE